MQPYPTVQNYSSFQPIAMPQPYPDRLTQLQNNYQQVIGSPPPVQVNQGLLWVQGESGAKSYLVAPNTTVLLMDSESQRFYLKTTDNSGMPNLRTFEYSEVTQKSFNALSPSFSEEKDKYVTRDEYEDLKSRYEEIMERLNNIQNTPLEKTVKKAKGATENE